ncbi:MAG TPA: acyltransferase [Eubacteriales bacterium]|nr:acyltransferase [Eubacteriales bacterium]
MKVWLERQWNKLTDYEVDIKHVDALDGIRALAVLCVLWFHFWQQTWLMPTYPTAFLSWLGIDQIAPGPIRWVGFIFVDMMVLLSGFLLFLPKAREMFYGKKEEPIGRFYRKRVARIIPSYLLCITVIFTWALVTDAYKGNMTYALRDLLSHLTFTYMLSMDTYAFTPLNGALWTICVEMWFYLFFPLISKLFKKWHILVYLVLVGLGAWYTQGIALVTQPTAYYTNQFVTFLPVFANGMLAATLYVAYAKYVKRKGLISLTATAVSIVCLIWIWQFVNGCYFAQDKQLWQLGNRYVLSLVFSLFILSTIISIRPYRAIFSNRVLRFIAGISFNLYIWHQWIMVRLVHSMGFLTGADVSAAGVKMQYLLNFEGLAVAFLIATVLTYFWERPMSKLIMGTLGKDKLKNETRI